MTSAELRRVLAASELTVAEIRQRDPELWSAIEKLATEQARRRWAARLETAPPDVRDRLTSVAPPATLTARELRSIRETVERADADLAELRDAREWLADVARELEEDPLAPGEARLRDLAFLRTAFDRARLHAVGDLGGVTAERMDRVAARAGTPEDLNEETLADLVAAGALADHEARTLASAASLFTLLDGNAALAKTVAASLRTGSGDPIDLRSLARLDAGAWGRLLRESGATRPVDRYAADLAARVAALYPTTSLISRLPPESEGLSLARRVHDAHPDLDLLRLDYTRGSADVARLGLANLGLTADEQERVRATLKTWQRVYAIANDVERTTALLAAGFTSSRQIATTPLAELLSRVGLDEPSAREVHRNARRAFATSNVMAASILDHWKGGFGWLDVRNTDPTIDAFLTQLEGFAQMFGSQAYCRCEHCQSILGPAAYFVDLMWFVEENVRKPFFAARPNHALDLATRRPDLWSLPLTCANTFTLVPTLEIVTEILEDFVARRAGYTGDLADRAAVTAVVYEQTLPAGRDSFRQPFFLPIDRLDAYLDRLDTSRGELVRTLDPGDRARILATLRLSPGELDLLTTPNLDLAVLRRIYDVDFVLLGSAIQAVDAQALLRGMDVARDELGTLLGTSFVNAGLAAPIEIRAEKRDLQSVQNDVENVHGLNPSALDRLHRFARLARRSSLAPAQLDMALTRMGAVDIDAAFLARVVTLRDCVRALGLPIEKALAVIGEIPPALYESLFNPPAFVRAHGRMQDWTRPFLHPSLRAAGSASPVDPALPRLLAALRLDDPGLLDLILALAPALGVDPQGPEDARRFPLDGANLALLARHVFLAEALRLRLADLFQLLALAPGTPGYVATLDHLAALLDAHAWWRSTEYTLDDLGLITRGPVRERGRYADPAATAANLIDTVSSSNAMIFADTIFALGLGVTEAESRAILAANAPRFVRLSGDQGLRLADDFDPDAPLAVPPGSTVDEAAARRLLRGFHAVDIIPRQLARLLGVSLEKLHALLAITGGSFVGGAWPPILRGTADAQPLRDVVQSLVPLAVLFRAKSFDAQAIDYVRAHATAFGVARFDALASTTLDRSRCTRRSRALRRRRDSRAIRRPWIRSTFKPRCPRFSPASGSPLP